MSEEDLLHADYLALLGLDEREAVMLEWTG